jgi:hypothetical protein
VVTVVEKWCLRPEVADRGLEIMQEMDDLVGPGAHADPAWAGHGHFYRSRSAPHEFLMIYPWRSVAEHVRLRAREEPILADFHSRYCSAEREIFYYDELEVEVEHEHEHEHEH